MKRIYRGCEIEVYRDKSLGGWSEIYWSAFSKDGFDINSGFGGGSVNDMYQSMKKQVDLFIDVYHEDEEKWDERS